MKFWSDVEDEYNSILRKDDEEATMEEDTNKEEEFGDIMKNIRKDLKKIPSHEVFPSFSNGGEEQDDRDAEESEFEDEEVKRVIRRNEASRTRNIRCKVGKETYEIGERWKDDKTGKEMICILMKIPKDVQPMLDEANVSMTPEFQKPQDELERPSNEPQWEYTAHPKKRTKCEDLQEDKDKPENETENEKLMSEKIISENKKEDTVSKSEEMSDLKMTDEENGEKQIKPEEKIEKSILDPQKETTDNKKTIDKDSQSDILKRIPELNDPKLRTLIPPEKKSDPRFEHYPRDEPWGPRIVPPLVHSSDSCSDDEDGNPVKKVKKARENDSESEDDTYPENEDTSDEEKDTEDEPDDESKAIRQPNKSTVMKGKQSSTSKDSTTGKSQNSPKMVDKQTVKYVNAVTDKKEEMTNSSTSEKSKVKEQSTEVKKTDPKNVSNKEVKLQTESVSQGSSNETQSTDTTVLREPKTKNTLAEDGTKSEPNLSQVKANLHGDNINDEDSSTKRLDTESKSEPDPSKEVVGEPLYTKETVVVKRKLFKTEETIETTEKHKK